MSPLLVTFIHMAQRLLREADIAHPAFQLGRIRKTAILLALPDLLTVDIDREDPPVPGTSVTEAMSVLKVCNSSCAIQLARSIQLHWEQ